MAITVYTYNDKVLKNISTNKWLKKAVDPYNPLGLPPFTIRVKFVSGFTPGTELPHTLVDVENNIWDLSYPDPYQGKWDNLLKYDNAGGVNLIEILGANTTNITSMNGLCNGCSNLTSVSLFDTSNVTNMGNMFRDCSSLTSVPLFDTSSVTNLWYTFGECSALQSIPLFDTSSATSMGYMFYQCTNVESGALALYQQASSQTTPPTDHAYTFTNCGSGTVTGAAELAQIPSGWK